MTASGETCERCGKSVVQGASLVYGRVMRRTYRFCDALCALSWNRFVARDTLGQPELRLDPPVVWR